MQNTNFSLSINNQEVFQFYKKHSLDFESMNILFYNVLKKIVVNMDQSLNSSLANRILEEIHGLNHKIINIEKDISNILVSKFNENRKEYMSDIRLLLTSNNVDYIAPLIEKTNGHFIDKTSLIINELIPKNNENLTKTIDANLKILKSNMMEETSKILNTNFDCNKIEMYMQNIHNAIKSSETNIEKQIQEENEYNKKLGEFLKKYDNNNAKSKGTFSENRVYNILLDLFPNAEIDNVSKSKETGDIMIVRSGKPTILIENKDHEMSNIPKNDVDKFIRDCNTQNCCGIMLAQNRGIANKNNFEIQLNNKNVLLYVHNVNFDEEKIKLAIDVVDNLKTQLDENDNLSDEYNIDIDTLTNINKEYLEFIEKKSNVQRTIKDFSDKMTLMMNELKFPSLGQFLSAKFAFSSKLPITTSTFAYSNNDNDTNKPKNNCPHCGNTIKKSLNQHLRYCPIKNNTSSVNNTPSVVESINLTLDDTTDLIFTDNSILSIEEQQPTTLLSTSSSSFNALKSRKIKKTT